MFTEVVKAEYVDGVPHSAMVQQPSDKSGGLAHLVKRQGVRASEGLELLQAVHRKV